MSQQEHSEENLLPIPEPMIQQQVENSTLGGGMQAAIGKNIQIQNSNNVTVNNTEILQISVVEIKTRKFIETSPYKGLKKFEPEDKDLFFGRDQFLQGLVDELEQTNLVLLLGASGSGKSSVVRAGLVPWLFRKYGTRLVNLIFTPDQDPFESLYASLLSKNTQQKAQIAREAKADTLTQVVTRLKQADDYWFILIDQFEELFTTSQSEKRDRFIASLVQLAKAKLLRVKIMATMRADFLDKLSPYPALVKATDKHRPMIAEMQPNELRLAIEQPAAHHGVVFETGLVEEIIKDVQGQAGYLPLLQYTLNLLWETEVKTGSINDRTLNISTYRELGGVRGALQQRVDKIYEDLSAPEKISTQRIFLKLVDIGGDEDSDTEWKPVRRRASRSEFSDDLEQAVLVKLIDNNLLVSDRPLQSQQSTVEIAHETLLTSWTTLNTWIKENRNSVALRNRLNDDVERWKASNAEDELWTGSKLEKVLELRKDATFDQVLGGFSETANQFINDSLRLRDRRRRRTIIGLASFSGIAVFLAGIAGWQWWQTELQKQQAQKAQIAQSEALSRYSDVLFNRGQEFEALIESLRAAIPLQHLKAAPRMHIILMLHQAVYGVKERNSLSYKDILYSLSFDPNGKILVSEGQEINSLNDRNVIKLWDIATGKEIRTYKTNKIPSKSKVFSPDGKTLAVIKNTQIQLLDASNGREIKSFDTQKVIAGSIRFSPDGKILAFGGGQFTEFKNTGNYFYSDYSEGTIKLWDITTGKEIHTFNVNKAFISTISFSPDGKILASGGGGNPVIVKLWDVASGKEIHTLTGYDYAVSSLAFSPDSKMLVSGSDDGIVKVWDIASGKEMVSLKEHSKDKISVLILSPDGKNSLEERSKYAVKSVVFSRDGKTLVSGGSDGTIKLWDVPRVLDIARGTQNALQGHTAEVKSITFSPDSKTLISGSYDGTIKIWDIATGKEISTLGASDTEIYPVISVSLSPDGKILASGGGEWENGILQLWDLPNRKKIRIIEGLHNFVVSLSFSPDGKTLAAAIEANGKEPSVIKIWDVVTGKELYTIKGHQGHIESISFSPDGKILASGSQDQTIKFWDTAIGKEIRTIQAHNNYVIDLNFSPDGKTLASASNDQTVTLWNVATGKEITILRSNSEVNSVSFSPDGNTLAAGSLVNSVKLWDISTGKEIANFKGHITFKLESNTSVDSVRFSPDGKTLAYANRNGTIIIWNLNLDDLLTKGCNWVRPYLQNNPNVSESDRHLCDGIDIPP